MGNYKDLEFEFIERTLMLISQYEHDCNKYKFEEQYNYTLLINCLLGLIVMPKERTLSLLPKHRLTKEFRSECGLKETVISNNINELSDLIIKLRHAVAHFNISVESYDDKFLVDEIVFKDKGKDGDIEIIRFKSEELLPFIRYYASWVLSNYKIKKARKRD